MKTYILGTLAALTLSLCVTSNASADWRYRERIRFDHGRRIVYQERYWAPVIVTTPAPVIVTPPVITTPAPVIVSPPVYATTAPVVVTGPVYSTGYFYGSYRPYYRHYRHRHHR
jgi:hypothetical protein